MRNGMLENDNVALFIFHRPLLKNRIKDMFKIKAYLMLLSILYWRKLHCHIDCMVSIIYS